MIENVMNWFQAHQEVLEQFGTLSLILLAITVVVLPIAVMKLPEDYFTNERRAPAGKTRENPLLWAALSLVKNVLGVILILVGVVMLVLPGQGMVTILIGLALTNFPGKFTVERRIAGQPAVSKTLNTIRRLGGQPPLLTATEISKE